MSPRGRAVAALREPWTLVLAGIGGGLTCAAGVPLAGAGVVAGGMLVAAAGVGALTSRSPGQRTPAMSITALQETFAELEADAAKVPPDDPRAGHA